MGTFIDVGNEGFASARKGLYVDKTGLIAVVNNTINTERRYSCVSRSRRFGKSMAARMLTAYYDRSCDSRELFRGLQAEQCPTFEEHLNRYPVIRFDVSFFTTRYHDGSIVEKMDAELRSDISEAFPNVPIKEGDDLMDYLLRIVAMGGGKFIFIIDEWDAILREFSDRATVDAFVNWLRHMFKSDPSTQVFAAVYMTGILPIKKYKTESALNNFTEYSVVDPMGMARYFGFTKSEVMTLAAERGMDFDELEKWYDGYQIGDERSMFNPNSVVTALHSKWCDSYWGRTGAYDAVAHLPHRTVGEIVHR